MARLHSVDKFLDSLSKQPLEEDKHYYQNMENVIKYPYRLLSDYDLFTYKFNMNVYDYNRRIDYSYIDNIFMLIDNHVVPLRYCCIELCKLEEHCRDVSKDIVVINNLEDTGAIEIQFKAYPTSQSTNAITHRSIVVMHNINTPIYLATKSEGDFIINPNKALWRDGIIEDVLTNIRHHGGLVYDKDKIIAKLTKVLSWS